MIIAVIIKSILFSFESCIFGTLGFCAKIDEVSCGPTVLDVTGKATGILTSTTINRQQASKTVDCTWKLVTEDPGFYIKLLFVNFSLSPIVQTILFRWKMFVSLMLAKQKSAAIAKVKMCVCLVVRARRRFLAPYHTP